MSDTIVIDGEVELLNVIDGDPDVFIGSGGSQPTGTKSILLTEAGTKTEDVTAYASAEINAVKDATASGAVASFSDGAEDVPMTSCVANIEPVQSGSGDPSPSNVRPISGWSEVKVSVTGVNLFDKNTLQAGYVDNTTGEIKSGSSGYKCTDFIRVASGNTYYIKTTQISAIWGAWYDKNKSFLSGITGYANTTKTAPANAYYMRLTVSSNSTGDANTFAVNYPSTDTEYHAYTAQEYPVSLGQTVYGGTLDVVTGVLTVDRVKVTKPSCGSVLSQTNPAVILSLSSVGAGVNSTANSKLIANVAPTVAPNNQYLYSMLAVALNSSSQLRLSVPGLTTKEEYLNWIDTNNLEVVYPLDTPQTIQLTPTEVTTLLGNNSVWADSGNISVGYKADVYLTNSTPTGTKSITITTNGTTTEDVTNYASASITTNVPASAVDSGTKSISSNGTHDVIGYASASVAVPNSYSASDEGKVVSNGALVSQTSDTVTANDTYDTTLINSLTVNVSGGSADNMLNVKYLKGSLNSEALKGAVLPEKANFEQVTGLGRNVFSQCTGMKILVCPAITTEDRYPYADNTVLETLDRGSSAPNFNYGYTFSGDSHFATLILRNTSVVSLPNLNCFANTPFASGGTGGTLYVPSALISSYQSATNWSTILGYANNSIVAIEGSQYENYYADGTPIS